MKLLVKILIDVKRVFEFDESIAFINSVNFEHGLALIICRSCGVRLLNGGGSCLNDEGFSLFAVQGLNHSNVRYGILVRFFLG